MCDPDKIEMTMPMTRRHRLMCAITCGMLPVALMIFSLVPDARATTVRRFAFDELCGGAGSIVVARCVAVTTEFDAAVGLPFTRTTFEVQDVLKGDPATRRVTVRMPGGAIAGRRTTIPGIPTFQRDGESVLFLTPPGEDGYPWVMGLAQGCYGIVSHPRSGERMVFQALTGLATYDPATARVLAKPAPARLETLESFTRRIRRLVNAASAPRPEAP